MDLLLLMANNIPLGLLEACVVVGASSDHLKELCVVMRFCTVACRSLHVLTMKTFKCEPGFTDVPTLSQITSNDIGKHFIRIYFIFVLPLLLKRLSHCIPQ